MHEENEIDTSASGEANTGEMRKRREKMADGKRYIIYYTFAESGDAPVKTEDGEVTENV